MSRSVKSFSNKVSTLAEQFNFYYFRRIRTIFLPPDVRENIDDFYYRFFVVRPIIRVRTKHLLVIFRLLIHVKIYSERTFLRVTIVSFLFFTNHLSEIYYNAGRQKSQIYNFPILISKLTVIRTKRNSYSSFV